MPNSISIQIQPRCCNTREGVRVTEPHLFQFNLRRSILAQNADGHTVWQEQVTPQVTPVAQVALILCDVWDSHWSRGARERLELLLPRMKQVVERARASSATIIHAPSETMEFYAAAPARQRALALPLIEPPPPLEHDDPPLPIDDSDQGSDTGESQTYRAWSRQHPAIPIDQERDFISDNGQQVYTILQRRGIQQTLILGVHTNMCILRRSFAIKQMVKWAVPIALVRDLTDTMYNPARSPYVSHAEGTQLVVGYIEKFWCPSIQSEDLLR
jgi:nicotinamidase-related amidase